jgi:glycosyltransferase involved in cell wall biosynthesis
LNNILYLPTRYFPSISGAEFYFQRIAEILTTNYSYNIEIFTSNAIDFKALRDPGGKIITEDHKFFYKVNSLEINRFPINYDVIEEEILLKLNELPSFKQLDLSHDSVKRFLRNGPYLETLLEYFIDYKTAKYDLIHTTYFPYFNLILSLMIGAHFNVPTVCTPFFHFSNPRYFESAIVRILRKFDFIIACTNLEKGVLIDQFKLQPKKIKVISMGVDYNLFKSVHNTTFKNYYFKPTFFNKKEENYKMVLFCGYKNYEKGALSILKAIPYIVKAVKKVYFVFIGPSTQAFNRELSKVQKFRNTRIINFTPDNLTGYYDKKKLTAFKEADVFLMPSRSDAFGIAFLEAWAAGIPVIGAKTGATPEVIRDNVDGLLVEFDNPIEIAQKVVKLLKSKKLRKKIGLRGQIKVSQNYTWDIIANKTHKMYQNLISTQR